MDNIQIHTCVVASGEFCYCRLCCDQRINYHTQKSFEQLEIDIELEFDSEERAINTVFQHVFTQICMSKAYRNKIEIESGYKRPFFYFRTHMSDEEARTKAKRIVEDCQVFDKFDKVLENLKKCPDVDIRRLKRSHLMMALNESRLRDLNSIFRSTGSPPEPEEELYTEDDFEDLVRIVNDHPVIQRVRAGKDNQRRMANLLRRLASNVHRGRKAVGNRQGR